MYCLEPIGVGSEYVESLTGYVARLAQQHCVTPRQLLLTEIAPHLARLKNRLNYQPETVSKVLGIDMCKPAANGMGLTAAYLVEALSALTKRNDLHKLSQLNWALLPKRGLLRHQRAWCPSCYLEWQQGGKTCYFDVKATLVKHYTPFCLLFCLSPNNTMAEIKVFGKSLMV